MRRKQADFDEVRYLDYTPSLKLMVVPEENVLGLPKEPFAGKCMVVSVFAKALYQVTGLRPVDPDFERRRDKQQYELRVKRLDIEFDQRLGKIYEAALGKGLWKGTPAARQPRRVLGGRRGGLLRRRRRRSGAEPRRSAHYHPRSC